NRKSHARGSLRSERGEKSPRCLGPPPRTGHCAAGDAHRGKSQGLSGRMGAARASLPLHVMRTANTSKCSGELHSAVSPICNRLATAEHGALAMFAPLQNAILRYSRLQICATNRAAFGKIPTARLSDCKDKFFFTSSGNTQRKDP